MKKIYRIINFIEAVNNVNTIINETHDVVAESVKVKIDSLVEKMNKAVNLVNKNVEDDDPLTDIVNNINNFTVACMGHIKQYILSDFDLFTAATCPATFATVNSILDVLEDFYNED